MKLAPEANGLPRLQCMIVLAIVVGLCARGRAEATTFICHEIDAFVINRGVMIDPTNPRVGDQVSINFDIDVLVYSSGPYALVGAEPLLAGDATSYYPSFQLTAVAAGTATLKLAITYLTEDACRDDQGHMFFTVGRYHTINLAPIELVIAEPAGCPGDCNGDGRVTVDEIIWGVRVALAQEPVESCTSLDRNEDGSVAVDDVVAAIYVALEGCDV